MIKQFTKILTILSAALGFSCADSVEHRIETKLHYLGAGHYGMGNSESDGVNLCSLSGPESHVVIATLVSSDWEKRVCGEKIPDSRFRYRLDVTNNILDAKKGNLEILGLERFGGLPRNAQPGDIFLLAYKKEQGENLLLQWVEIFENDVETADRNITLPSEKLSLIKGIRNQRGKKCETNFVGFKTKKLVQNWSHTNCGDPTVHPPQSQKLSNGVDQ